MVGRERARKGEEPAGRRAQEGIGREGRRLGVVEGFVVIVVIIVWRIVGSVVVEESIFETIVKGPLGIIAARRWAGQGGLAVTSALALRAGTARERRGREIET